MFKNCCGCPNKKTIRRESEEDGKKEEMENTVQNMTECKVEKTTKTMAQKVEDTPKDAPKDDEIVQKKPSSLKKPKPRLSISADVKIIPSNFPEDQEDYSPEEDIEESREEQEQEDAEDEPEEMKIVVKDIDGKMIRKSQSGESSRKASLEGEPRTISPLSDEVFVANEKSHLDLPLHNLGVKVEVLPLGPDAASSPKKQSPNCSQKRVSMPAVLPQWLSEEDETGGSQEPPATPVARDELALRRHRFFSELLTVAQAATEHRVRFDPFGPSIEILSEVDQGSTQAQAKEFDNLLKRLENITLRLEKAVPLLEKGAEACVKNFVVTKSLEDLLDEHLTPTEKESLNLLISSQLLPGEEETKVENLEEKDGFIIISPDSSADFDELSDKDLVLLEDERIVLEGEKLQNNASDRSETSSNSQNTVVSRLTEERREERERVKENLELDLNEVKKGKNCEILEKLFREEKPDMTNSKLHEMTVAHASVSLQFSCALCQSTLNMSIQGFQRLLQEPLACYIRLSNEIGEEIAEQAKLVEEAFQIQLQYLIYAAQASKPSFEEQMDLLKPTSDIIESILNFREKHRTSIYFNHLSAVSESVTVLGWVAINTPVVPYVKEMSDCGQFYLNRVLKDWKDKNSTHVEWSKAWIQVLSEFHAYIKEYHTTGLVWGKTSGARVGGGPPPPPVGMPPPPSTLDLGDVSLVPGQDRSALFAEINQGENITRNLKKVTPDMQTHKNPGMRAGPAPFKSPPSSISNQVPKPFRAPSPPEKPPKFAREGKKWIIEYQKGNQQLVVENAEMNNVVYMYKCMDSTLSVKGKVNSIFLDSCKKTAVVFDSVVSSIEFVNCQSVQMQVLGMVPTVSIDKTDGCQMYLSQDSLDVEIVSSKSSEMNVLVPTSSGDFKEFPVPEQFKTTVSKQGLMTTAVESKG